MPSVSRRRALAIVAGAAGTLLVPARVHAAVSASGRVNVREHPGGIAAAVSSGQPLYVPAGDYELPSGLVLTQPLDVLGDASRPPMLRWGKGHAFIPGAAPVRFQHCRFADSRGGYLVNMDETAVEVPYIGVLDCTFEDVGGVIGWPTTRPLRGSMLRRLEVRRVEAKNVGRGIMVQGGTTVRFDVEDYTCDGYTRFGLLIGPVGGRYQPDMESGVARRIRILNGSIKKNTSKSNKNNNNGVYIAGRNVELDDLHIENLGNGGQHDTEGLYTKVIHLRAANIRLVNAGGNQGFYGCKSGDKKKGNRVIGSDTAFENLEIICTDGHKGTGVWYQAYDAATFAKVKTVGLTGPALRMHKNSDGPLIIREWQDIDGRRTKASVFDLRGPNRVEFIDCSVTPATANVIRNPREAVTVVERNNSW
jgi:hypothetical protein